MRVLARQPEANEENGRPEHPLEIANDRDGPPFTDDDGLLLECRRKRSTSCVVERSGQLGLPRASTVEIRHRRLHSLRSDPRDVRLKLGDDFLRILIRYEAEA